MPVSAADSRAVTVTLEPSATGFGAAESRTVAGAASSSVIVSVLDDGLDTPPPLAVPDTVTVLSAASTELFTAVIVTVPALAVWPAAIVSVLLVESVKSPDNAGETAAADTVTVTCALDAADSVAVTVLAPPFSEIEDGLSARLTVGTPSSSVIVSVSSPGFDTPPPLAAPDTVTVLSAASTALSAAVIVTVPVLAVAPAAMVSVLLVESVKSPDNAGETAAADTVTVTCALDAADSVAVTVLAPPFSEIEDGLSARLTVGTPSSSVIVSVSSPGFDTPPPLAAPDTVTVLSAASTALSAAVIVTVPVLAVAPAAMVSVLLVESVKSPATAGETAAADTVTVTAALDAADSVAVTVLDPPFSEIDAGDSSRVTCPLDGVPDGVPEPLAQGLTPWLLVARTHTSYAVPLERASMTTGEVHTPQSPGTQPVPGSPGVVASWSAALRSLYCTS